MAVKLATFACVLHSFSQLSWCVAEEVVFPMQRGRALRGTGGGSLNNTSVQDNITAEDVTDLTETSSGSGEVADSVVENAVDTVLNISLAAAASEAPPLLAWCVCGSAGIRACGGMHYTLQQCHPHCPEACRKMGMSHRSCQGQREIKWLQRLHFTWTDCSNSPMAR